MNMTQFYNDQTVEAVKAELCRYEIKSRAHADLLIEKLERDYDWVAVDIALEQLGVWE